MPRRSRSRSTSSISTPAQLDEFYTALEEAQVDVVGAEQSDGRRREGVGCRGGDLDRHPAALPQGHRQGAAPHGSAGGRAREADRARRARRQAGDGRGQPPARRLDREAVPQPGAAVPRPDPGGDDRPRARRREVRLPQGLQVLDLRHLVDPPGRRPRDRRQGPDDPDAGARRREAQQDPPLGAQAPRRARPRADDPRDRRSTSTSPSRRSSRSGARRRRPSRSRSRSATTTSPSSATSSPTRRRRCPTRRPR